MAIFGEFLRSVFQRAACSTFQTCVLNSHWANAKRDGRPVEYTWALCSMQQSLAEQKWI